MQIALITIEDEAGETFYDVDIMEGSDEAQVLLYAKEKFRQRRDEELNEADAVLDDPDVTYYAVVGSGTGRTVLDFKKGFDPLESDWASTADGKVFFRLRDGDTVTRFCMASPLSPTVSRINLDKGT